MVRIGTGLVSTKDRTDLRVLDPSCGTASFLTSFAEIHGSILEVSGGKASREGWLCDEAPTQLLGVDTSERMVRLAAASFVSARMSPSGIYLDNAIEPISPEVKALLQADTIDLIVTNPPFGAEHGKGKHGIRALPSEIVFLDKYMAWLKQGGIAISIVPDSVLTNKGVFSALRNRLSLSSEILAVISLPPVTFAASGTTTKTSVLIFRKCDETSGSRKTFFAVANSVGFHVSTRGSIRKRIQAGINELTAIADDLLFESEESASGVWRRIDPNTERWDAQYWNSPLSGQGSTITQAATVRIGDVAELVRDRADPSKLATSTFQYIEISGIDGDLMRVSATETPVTDAPSRARRRVKAGDVLVSTVRPERKTVGVVPPYLDGSICSTGLAILRPLSISPYALAAALKSPRAVEQLVGISSGVAYPAFEAEVLPGIEIDLGSEEWQQSCKKYGIALEALEEIRAAIT